MVTAASDRWNRHAVLAAGWARRHPGRHPGRHRGCHRGLHDDIRNYRRSNAPVINFLTLVGDGGGLGASEYQGMAETFELATQEGTRSRERDHSRAHSQNARMNPACEPTIGQIHLQQLFEHSPVPTIVVDRDMRYMTMSQSWREVFGIEAPDILGRSHYDFTPYISEEWKREHQSCLAGETIDNPDDCVRMSDGAEIWMRRRIHPWRDSEGTISGLVITNEIITESVAADQALEY
jgi:PAS domain S-box-containing protein